MPVNKDRIFSRDSENGLDAANQVDVFKAGEGGYHSYRVPSVIVTKKGTLLAFCEGRKHHRSDAGDIDLVLRCSFDDGKTWPISRLIYQQHSDYSCLTVLPDKSIGIFYGRDKYSKITFARFTLQWLARGQDSVKADEE